MTARVRGFSRYAPISERSPLLVRIAGAYFMFSGVAIAIAILFTALFTPDLLKGQRTPFELGLGLAVTLVWAAGLFWTGSLLADKSRRGAYYAAGFVVLHLIDSFDLSTAIFSAVSLAVLASIWKHLE